MGVKCKMVNRGGMRYRENGFWGFGFCIYIWDLSLSLSSSKQKERDIPVYFLERIFLL